MRLARVVYTCRSRTGLRFNSLKRTHRRIQISKMNRRTTLWLKTLTYWYNNCTNNLHDYMMCSYRIRKRENQRGAVVQLYAIHRWRQWWLLRRRRRNREGRKERVRVRRRRRCLLPTDDDDDDDDYDVDDKGDNDLYIISHAAVPSSMRYW